MKMKFSERDNKGRLYVDCIECNRGFNGTDNDKCSAGSRVRKGHKRGCFSGELMPEIIE